MSEKKEIFLDLTECRALGDTICSTPTLRRLSKTYQQKIIVITNYPEIFKNNPYVKKVYSENAINIEYVKINHLYHNSFHSLGFKDQFGVETNIIIRIFVNFML